MKLKTLLFIALMASSSIAFCQSPESIVGTWSLGMRTQEADGVTSLGVVYVIFSPNGTFRKDTQLLNGQLHAWGHYRFDGHTLYYVVDNYSPKYIGTYAVPEPAYHHWLREPVEFNGEQMFLNGDYWTRHTQY